ncbi:hypothetical protein ACRRTK_002367 [Alexandromys fortis]
MPGKISAGDKGLEWREKVLWTQDTFHVDMERGCLLKLTLASTSQVHQGRNLRSLLEKGDIPEDRASSQPGPSKHTGYAQAPQALARPLQRAPISGLPGGLAIAPEPLRTMEQQDTVDVACGPSDSECNMGNETGAPLVIGPGLRGRARPRGRGRSCTTRIQARTTEPKTKVGVCLCPSNLECSMENKTGAPRGIKPGLRGHASRRGRGANGGTRTQTRNMDQSHQVNVCFWPSNLECNTGNETGAPLGIEPGLRGHASRPGSGRGANDATRTQTGCVDQTPLPCSSMEYHPPETQVPAEKFGLQNGPVTSDQASVSDTIECEEILQAAAALMTLKNSSWIWR